MAIVRWDPFREVAQLQDRLSRVIGDAYGRNGADDAFLTTGEWVPPVDIFAEGDHELALPAKIAETLSAAAITVEGGEVFGR